MKKKSKAKKRAPAFQLTETQHKILLRCAKGQTYEQTGRGIGMTRDGVDWHIRNILKALRARNTTNAVYKAFKLGLID